MFFIDVIATFPYELVLHDQYETILIRLLRLLRLPDTLDLLDLSKLHMFIKKLISNNKRNERVIFTFILTNIYRVFKLICSAIIITYFVGTVWYIISNQANNDYADTTFVKAYEINSPFELLEIPVPNSTIANLTISVPVPLPSSAKYTKFITSFYFSLTTLAVIGYGDLCPKSNLEMVIDMLIMVFGVAFFSFIMGSFINIISKFDDLFEDRDESNELNNWLSLQFRYRNNKPLDKEFLHEIGKHFQYMWSNDRLQYLDTNDEFLNALPRSLKRSIMVQYMFDDVFYKFKNFFLIAKHNDYKFLYDISFGFKPRQFSPNNEFSIIYDEEEDVSEMYLITSG